MGVHNSLFSTTLADFGGAKVFVERNHWTKEEEPVLGEAMLSIDSNIEHILTTQYNDTQHEQCRMNKVHRRIRGY